MEDFTKTVRLGTAETYGGRKMSVYASVKYRDGRLSISGVEGPLPSGNALGSCGQIDMSYRDQTARDALRLAPGWTRDDLEHFFAVWDKWHLNDMQAGSPAQTAILNTPRSKARLADSRDHYATCRAILAENNCDPDPAYLHNGEPYRYGTAWLAIPVPDEVLAFLHGLPDTDRTPAWV